MSAFSRPHLAVSGLRVTLGGREILDGSLSFAFDVGNVVTVLGPNGSGKSTLIKSICGLIEPQAGKISISGESVRSMSLRQRACHIAYVPQQEVFAAPYTVREIVIMGRFPQLKGFSTYGAEDAETADAALEKLEIEHLADRVVTELSGGEGSRVVIARALAQKTKIVLMDEPTAALDPKHARRTMDIARELADEGKLIVMAMHDINLALSCADEMIFLKEGAMLADCGVGDVTEKMLRDVYDMEWSLHYVGGKKFAVPA